MMPAVESRPSVEGVVLVVAPLGQDAPRICSTLSQAGIAAQPQADLRSNLGPMAFCYLASVEQERIPSCRDTLP